jgi:hypothetical protein
MSQEHESTTGHRPQRIFDLRLMIGGVFLVYGIALTVAGMLDTAHDLDKAGGLPINLWTGLGMLALGTFFLLWAKFGRQEGRPEQQRHDPVP